MGKPKHWLYKTLIISNLEVKLKNRGICLELIYFNILGLERRYRYLQFLDVKYVKILKVIKSTYNRTFKFQISRGKLYNK